MGLPVRVFFPGFGNMHSAAHNQLRYRHLDLLCAVHRVEEAVDSSNLLGVQISRVLWFCGERESHGAFERFSVENQCLDVGLLATIIIRRDYASEDTSAKARSNVGSG
jgi:hypothetical protein